MLNEPQMQKLAKSPLFWGLAPEQISLYLQGIGAKVRGYEAGAILLSQGETQPNVNIVLSGSARGEKLTADGRSVIVSEFSPGDLFGEMLSAAFEKSLVTVFMAAGGQILSIPYSALISGVANMKNESEQVLRNLINEITQKYFGLMKHLDMLICPTLRGKIALYLLGERETEGIAFEVPHSREEQAKLLNCDRSALSRELSRLKQEGVIDVHGRQFTILNMAALKSLPDAVASK